MKLKFCTCIVLLSMTLSSFSREKIIYGEDDRVDVYDSQVAEHVEWAKSTAAMIPNERLIKVSHYEFSLKAKTLAQRGICSSERFSEQLTAANCSGFLVAKNKLVTAGHCIRNEQSCADNSWVFDYKLDSIGQMDISVEKSDVYRCKKIITRSLDEITQMDYALIELDREVEDRQPLKIRKSGKPKAGDSLVVIGHPSGLPTKITSNGKVRTVNDIFLVSNLDTYGGNSGSAVFNATTGLVEGILVRGDVDYVRADGKNCRVSNVKPELSGRGEDVTLIGNIKELLVEEEQSTKVPAPKKPRLPWWWRLIFR